MPDAATADATAPDAADDAAADVAEDAAADGENPTPRRGWWQRTFGN